MKRCMRTRWTGLVLIPFLAVNMVLSAPIICGGKFTNDTGILSTPLYPRNYPNGVECIWLIKTEKHKYIELTFLDFDIEPFETCKTDMLEIKDGNDKYSPMIGGQYCNLKKPPKIVTSTSDSLRLWFHADSRDTFRGFKARYRTLVQSGCGSTLTKSHSIITSPRYPLPYPSDSKCEWKIIAPSNKYILVQFLDFEVEYLCRADGTCQCMDKLFIWDGKKGQALLVGEYCFHPPSPFVSQTNAISIKFSSSPIGRLRGFKILYTFSSTQGCGGDFFVPNGTFTSPNFAPAAKITYPSSSNCIWTVNAPKDYYVSLKFKYFDVKSGYLGICGGDYIEIRDGKDKRSPMIGQFCNTNKPDVILSSNNMIYLHFKSNGRRHGLGFEVKFRIHSKACENGLGMEHGQISNSQLSASSYLATDEPAIEFTPSLGRLNGRFAWCSQIQTSPILGEYYQIEFRHFYKITRLATQGFALSDKESNYVSKYRISYAVDGNFQRYRGVQGDNIKSPYTEFTGNHDGNGIKTNIFHPPLAVRMLRIYPTDFVYSRRKVLCLRAEVYGCRINFGDGRLYSATQGRVSFNSAQSRHETSTWVLAPQIQSENTVYYVTFHSFSINCQKARLKLSYGSQFTNFTSFCGSNRPQVQVYPSTRQLWIQYESLAEDETNSYQWFDLSYFPEDLGKGALLRSQQGIVRSPRSVIDTRKNESIWVILQPQGKRIKLEFLKLFLEQESNGTCRDYIEVRDGVLDDSPRLGLFCGNVLPAPQVSSGSQIKLSLRKKSNADLLSRQKRDAEIFELKYSTVNEKAKSSETPTSVSEKGGKVKSSTSDPLSSSRMLIIVTAILYSSWVMGYTV